MNSYHEYIQRMHTINTYNDGYTKCIHAKKTYMAYMHTWYTHMIFDKTTKYVLLVNISVLRHAV